jgi:hypothetical protein
MQFGSCKRPAALLVLSALVAVLPLLAASPLHAQEIPASQDEIAGFVHGVIFDESSAVVPNATVTLTRDNAAPVSTTTDDSGTYTFANIPAGKFHLAITALGFAPQSADSSLLAGEIHTVPQITLAPTASATNVVVHTTNRELAIQQVHQEEQQRVLGIVPNFYVAYSPNTVALPARQKFQLAGRYFIDPVNLGSNAALAGIEEASNTYSGFGTGGEGYAKYLGASLATFATSSLIANALLPTVLHQDPRYYVKGTGTTRARILYALANVVVCKGDNRQWQPNYSGLGGGLAASSISNFYYPAANRNGVSLTFENFAIGLAGGFGGNIFQEFFSRRMSTGIPKSF